LKRERERKGAWIERSRELGEIQNVGRRELTGDSTYSLRDCKVYYLYT
jgi:hypothetical protein